MFLISDGPFDECNAEQVVWAMVKFEPDKALIGSELKCLFSPISCQKA